MDDQTEKLKTYVKQQLQSGIESRDIVAQLTNANWPPEAIKKSIDEVLAEMKPSMTQSPAAAPVPDIIDGKFTFQPPHAATIQPAVTTVRRWGRIRTGWLLFKQSMVVLRGNKYLLRYLLMTYLVVMLVTVGFVALYLVGNATVLNNSQDSNGYTTLFGYGVLFINYVIVCFVINYYAAGLTANILDIFQGKRQPHHVYMAAARSRAMPIFVLAVFSATIGVILQYIIERLGWLGRLITFFVGTAWSLATMFTVPIILTSDKHAPAAIKSSAKLLRDTWGESITAKVSVNLPLFLLNVLVSMIAWFSILFIMHSVGDAGWIVLIVWLVVYIAIQIGLAIVGSFANSLVNTAVFYYASYHQVPAAFSEELLNQVFIAHKHRFFKRNKTQS